MPSKDSHSGRNDQNAKFRACVTRASHITQLLTDKLLVVFKNYFMIILFTFCYILEQTCNIFENDYQSRAWRKPSKLGHFWGFLQIWPINFRGRIPKLFLCERTQFFTQDRYNISARSGTSTFCPMLAYYRWKNCYEDV